MLTESLPRGRSFGLSASALRDSRRLIELAHGRCLQQQIDLRTTGGRGPGERRHEFPRIETEFLKFCEHSSFFALSFFLVVVVVASSASPLCGYQPSHRGVDGPSAAASVPLDKRSTISGS